MYYLANKNTKHSAYILSLLFKFLSALFHEDWNLGNCRGASCFHLACDAIIRQVCNKIFYYILNLNKIIQFFVVVFLQT